MTKILQIFGKSVTSQGKVNNYLCLYHIDRWPSRFESYFATGAHAAQVAMIDIEVFDFLEPKCIEFDTNVEIKVW